MPSQFKLYRIILITFFLSQTFYIKSQNLAPNPGFENLISCPTTPALLCEELAPPWYCPTNGSTDLFNACGGPSSLYGVPANIHGYQPAISGQGYAGIVCRWLTNGREYLQAPLTQPLVAGEWYNVSFYVSKVEDYPCGIEKIGAYFSEMDFYMPITTYVDVEPQVEHGGGFLMDTANWMLISGCFQAEGGEAFITIGNFRDDSESPVDPDCVTPIAYYYVENVVVEAGATPGQIIFDLGEPEIACFQFEIDPDHPGPNFMWSDGSNGPTLVVNSSGTYILTITDGCNEGIDSIEVLIGGNNPPVDLGPEQIVICEGGSHTISLDPDLYAYEWHDGSTDPEYSISSPGTFAVTLNDGCASSSDEIEVEVLAPPAPFSLGEDMSLCEGDEILLELDPSLGDFIWHDGTTGSTYLIDMGGTYTVTISNMCGFESDMIIITDLAEPQVDIGPAEVELCVGDFIEIEIDPASGDIVWQDGSTASIYQITSSGNYAVFVSNACGATSDHMAVTEVVTPVVDLGPDLALCEGDTVLLSTDLIPGTYLWHDNSSGTDYQVSSSGTYALTISNSCGIDSDSVSVVYTPLVVAPDFGPDVSLCPGEEIMLHASNPSGFFLWQDLSVADTFLVNTAGTYWVQVSNSCGMASDTIFVNISNDPPEVELPEQLLLCQGTSAILDAGISGVAYLWSDNSQAQQLAVTSPGEYSVTVSNSCGADADTVMVLDGGPAPTVDLGADLQLCPGDQFVLSPAFANVNTWLWQDGSTLPCLTASDSGTITVEGSNACGFAYDTLQVNLLPAIPLLNLGIDTSLCPDDSISFSISIPDVQILWSDGSTGPDFSFTGTGSISATVSNACGQSVDTITIDALPEIPLLDLGPDRSLCPGEVIILMPGIDDVNYTWQDGSTGDQFQTSQAGKIILTISNSCGFSSDTLEIVESTEGPLVDLGPDIYACEGDVVTIDAGISGVQYLWQDGSTSVSFVADTSVLVILHISNACGMDTDTLDVDISGTPPNTYLGPDTTVCAGLSLVLYASNAPGTNVQWQDGSISAVYTVSSPGLYTLHEVNMCGEDIDSILVDFLESPLAFSLGHDTVLCAGEYILLQSPMTSAQIEWQDGSSGSSFEVDQPGFYTLQLFNVCGEVSDSIEVKFDTQPVQIELDDIIQWCIGESIVLDATQEFPAIYHWSTGSHESSIVTDQPGFYSVEVTLPCSHALHDVQIVADPDCKIKSGIYVPNVFSPDNDFNNDIFFVQTGSDIEIHHMEGFIYDRWGNVVFSSTNFPFVWNGQMNGSDMLPGVYVYRIMCRYGVAGIMHEEILSGDVTLIR